MTPTAPQSSSSINFSHLPLLRPPPPRTASPAGCPTYNIAGPGTSTSTPPPFPYPSNLTPMPSPLRPHCAAKDQLEKWLPHPSTLSLVGPATHPELQDRVKAVTLQGWADSTRASYGAGLLVYHVFCDDREVPERNHAPASAALISSFISALAGSLSGKAIHNYIYGVRAWHTLYGLPWTLHEEQVSTMLKGASKLAPTAVKQDKRKPVTAQMISLIRDKLNLDDPFDTAFLACLTTIFYSAARVGEFTVPRLDSFNPVQHISRTGVHDDTDCNGLHTKVFLLPCTKSCLTGEEVHWARQDGPTDPLSAFNRHISINDPPADGPLFAYKSAKGYRPMTWQTFVVRLNKVAQAAGLNHVHGHSICIGATLEYLLRGVPFDVVKVKGHWASNAFQLYLRKHNQILAPYMQSMPPETALEFTRLAMPPVH